MATRRPSRALISLGNGLYRPASRMRPETARPASQRDIVTLEQMLDALGTLSKKNAGQVVETGTGEEVNIDARTYDRGSSDAS